MMDHVREVIANSPAGTKFGDFELDFADDFSYTDPVDGSVASGQVNTRTESSSRSVTHWFVSTLVCQLCSAHMLHLILP